MRREDSVSDATRIDLPVLRDDLALHRTTLANERTMLAYLRTALTFFAAGVTFVKFFDHPFIIALGWLLLPVSLATLVRGLYSYNRMRGEIVSEERDYMKGRHNG